MKLKFDILVTLKIVDEDFCSVSFEINSIMWYDNWYYFPGDLLDAHIQ